MDQTEILLKQLVKQVKILNFWVGTFGILFLVTFLACGVLIFKMVVYIHDSEQKISSLESKTSQTLDVQSQACNNSTIKNLLGSSAATYCK